MKLYIKSTKSIVAKTLCVREGDNVKHFRYARQDGRGEEYIGDVMNVFFTNGWIADEDGKVFIYYASSDTRMHVATSTVDRLVDYCMNTEPDALTTGESVKRLNRLIDMNLK